MEAGPLSEVSQGFTYAAKAEYASHDDMMYFVNDCPAHKVLKAGSASLGVAGIMTVYYTPDISKGVALQ
jgi:hypothetical protein